MRIREVHIRNFRAIDQLDLVFSHPGGKTLDLVMLAGPNGCGKTSLMEACLMALKQDKGLVRRPPQQPYVIDVVVEREGECFTIRRDQGQHVVIEPDGHQRSINGSLHGLKTFYFSSWRAPKLVGSVGLSTGRGKKPLKTDDNSLWRLKQHLVNSKGAKAYKAPAGVTHADADEVFRRINEIWSEFYPEKKGVFDAEIVTPESKRRDDEEDGSEDLAFDLLLRDRDHSSGVPVDELSSGEIEVLSMIGTFVIEKAQFDIVFVDEPELHLHSAWHRAIMRALRKAAPDTQFICATHSGEILDSVYSFERFTLLPEDDPRVRQFQSPNSTQEVAE
jgi:ABC-type lipoprotein export system ATPase subunit